MTRVVKKTFWGLAFVLCFFLLQVTLNYNIVNFATCFYSFLISLFGQR